MIYIGVLIVAAIAVFIYFRMEARGARDEIERQEAGERIETLKRRRNAD